MNRTLNRLLTLLEYFIKAIFSTKKKALLFSAPSHPNLGDQAQLMCTEKWIKENFPGYKLFVFDHLLEVFNSTNPLAWVFDIRLFQHIVLKLTIRKRDILVGHSGYFFVDHHGGWYSYAYLLRHWGNRFIILPQTVNFYAPVVKARASHAFGDKSNLTILCRDKVSFANASKSFGSTKLLLYPDIVTSLVGTRKYAHVRDGVLFCMRNDIEAFYSSEEIDALMSRFGDIHKEKADTTIKVSENEMKRNRDKLINDTIEKFSKFKVVVTDRYHGTIFAAIANTPVIVINSADHKLSSGVTWFPKEQFKDNVRFANNLEEAYEMTSQVLRGETPSHTNPPYFKENYWDKLASSL